MRFVLRFFGWLLVFVLILLLVGFFYLSTSLPRVRGELTLPGLRAPVEVVRDADAVPHIYASSAEDAYFALGFVHAQDRLWQMEFQRRVAAGRLAEVVGEAALDTDMFIRTLGIYRQAEATFPNLSPYSRGLLLAYTNGVNASLEHRRGPLPPEFLVPPILGHAPEPWRPADTLAWLKMLSWDLSGNWRDEILRARLATLLTDEQVRELWPAYPSDGPVALAELRPLYEGLPLETLLARAPQPLPRGSGSNNWVVSGEHTVSGMPLLANDPHLGLLAPSLWYLAHLSAPGLNVIGATLPGVPFIILGRNDHIAWGFTNTGTDVQDLYIERLDPEDPSRYLTPEGSEPFIVRRERFLVRNGEERVLTVRESRHGPIISDVYGAGAEAAGAGHVLAFAWPTLRPDDLTFQAGVNVNRARNWDEFVGALRHFHSPHQNIVYADIEGNIGFISPSRVPVRASGEGIIPFPGWTGDYDWLGWIPYEELPRAFNPPSGMIVTANNKIVPDDYPYFLTNDWAEPYRAERIIELLEGLEQHSVTSFMRIQADVTSRMVADFLPFFLAATPESEVARAAQALLLGWDGSMGRDRPEGLIFSAWFRELTRLMLYDDLGDFFEEAWGYRTVFVLNTLRNEGAWCDDLFTPTVESCRDLVTRALEFAVRDLRTTYGSDMRRWRWGDAHVAVHRHAIFGDSPLAGLFNLRLPTGGDRFTVNAAPFRIHQEGFVQFHGAAYRGIYDMAQPDTSLFMQSTGQSGSILSRHYRHLVTRWRDGGYVRMSTLRREVERNGLGTLVLRPQR